MKKIGFFMVFVHIFAILSACTPALHQRLPVRAIGIDADANGYLVSVCAASTEREGAEAFYSAIGDTVPDALEKIEQDAGKKAMYAHTAVLVYGRACAESGIESSLDFLIRHYDSKPTIRFCVSNTTAQALLKPQNTDSTPGADLEEQLQNIGQESNRNAVDLIELIHRTQRMDSAVAVPLFDPGDPPLPAGTTVLQEFRLTGDLSKEAELGYGILRGCFSGKVLNLYTESCGVTAVRTDRNTAEIRFIGTKEIPRFEIKIQIKGEISAMSKGVQQPERAALDELEAAYEHEIFRSTEIFLEETVYAQHTDLLGLRRCAEEACLQESDNAVSEDTVFDIRIDARIDRIEEENSPLY